MKNLADSSLNSSAEAVEDAQTLIRIAVKNGYLNGKTWLSIYKIIQEIIAAALKEIPLPSFKADAARSLYAFARRQYEGLRRSLGIDTLFLAALLSVSGAKVPIRRKTASVNLLRSYPSVRFETTEKGVPLQRYAKDYIREKVEPVLERLAREKALDPNDTAGRNSLRNLAEMEARYNEHLQQITDLRAQGVKLVVSSVHADCSDRCYPFQGRVYSLDGTSGITIDGKPYVPIEQATDIWYTTKAGKRYKNGLLGFNCRHYLYAYVPGMAIPFVDKETRQREYAVNTKQRAMERRVRECKALALELAGVNVEKQRKYRKKATEARKAYEAYSRANNRAFYPDRIKIV